MRHNPPHSHEHHAILARVDAITPPKAFGNVERHGEDEVEMMLQFVFISDLVCYTFVEM